MTYPLLGERHWPTVASDSAEESRIQRNCDHHTANRKVVSDLETLQMGISADLLGRRNRAIPRGVSTAYPIFAAKADNAELWDVEGRRFVDFGGGIAVLNTGHRHPRVVKAIQDQVGLFTHTAFQVVAYESYVELAERLNALAPFSDTAKTVLFSTGAEATENAVKIARAATGRSGVIAFSGAFHGRTMLSMAMTVIRLRILTPFGVQTNPRKRFLNSCWAF